MGRAAREFTSGSIYHVFSRGSNRQAIFLFDADRIDFLSCLERVLSRHRILCLSYCLLPNHYHLLLQCLDDSLSGAMKALNGRYSLRFNQRYTRDAHLFKNRFGAVEQETESQFLWTLRYIATNPVEAGLCARPHEWPWSSYRASVGLSEPPPFLALRMMLSFLSDEPESGVARYRELVEDSLLSGGV